jgi:hypothetical protein
VPFNPPTFRHKGRDFLPTPFTIRTDGTAPVTDRVGLGIDLDEAKVQELQG